jgi:hypothetical protein
MDMAKLVEKSKVGGCQVAFACDDCGEVFPVPSEVPIEEQRQILTQQFQAHVREKHPV